MKPTYHQNLSTREVELTEFFSLLGFALHKCCTGGDGTGHTTGGLCLTPEPGGHILVGWAINPCHRHRAGDDATKLIRDMLATIRAALERADYSTEPGPLGRSVRVLAT